MDYSKLKELEQKIYELRAITIDVLQAIDKELKLRE